MFLLIILIRIVIFSAAFTFLPFTFNESQALPTPSVTTTTTKEDWRIRISKIIFAWTLTECTLLFLLLIFQSLQLLSPQSRLESFQISLHCLLLILLFIIPQLTSYFILKQSIMTSIIPVILSLFVLSQIPLHGQLTRDATWLTRTLSRLLVLGTCILGLLAGFGAVTRAWDYLPFLNRYRQDEIPTLTEITTAEANLENVRRDLERRRANATTSNDAEAPKSSGWLSRMNDTLRGGDSVTLELKGLETLEQSLSQSLSSLKSRYHKLTHARTLSGRLYSFIGRLFACYCILRSLTAIYNLLFLRSVNVIEGGRETYPDIVTKILVALFVHDEDEGRIEEKARIIASFTHHASLVLVGLIVMSSLGVVMRGVNGALKITSKKLGSSLILLGLAYLMGIYLLSTLVQLRSSFPPTPSSSSSTEIPNENESEETNMPTTTNTNLFELIPPYELYTSLFDFTFLLAVVGTAGIRWGVDRLRE